MPAGAAYHDIISSPAAPVEANGGVPAPPPPLSEEDEEPPPPAPSLPDEDDEDTPPPPPLDEINDSAGELSGEVAAGSSALRNMQEPPPPPPLEDLSPESRRDMLVQEIHRKMAATNRGDGPLTGGDDHALTGGGGLPPGTAPAPAPLLPRHKTRAPTLGKGGKKNKEQSSSAQPAAPERGPPGRKNNPTSDQQQPTTTTNASTPNPPKPPLEEPPAGGESSMGALEALLAGHDTNADVQDLKGEVEKMTPEQMKEAIVKMASLLEKEEGDRRKSKDHAFTYNSEIGAAYWTAAANQSEENSGGVAITTGDGLPQQDYFLDLPSMPYEYWKVFGGEKPLEGGGKKKHHEDRRGERKDGDKTGGRAYKYDRGDGGGGKYHHGGGSYLREGGERKYHKDGADHRAGGKYDRRADKYGPAYEQSRGGGRYRWNEGERGERSGGRGERPDRAMGEGGAADRAGAPSSSSRAVVEEERGEGGKTSASSKIAILFMGLSLC